MTGCENRNKQQKARLRNFILFRLYGINAALGWLKHNLIFEKYEDYESNAKKLDEAGRLVSSVIKEVREEYKRKNSKEDE